MEDNSKFVVLGNKTFASTRCLLCGKEKLKEPNQLRKFPRTFCNPSCAAIYNNNIARSPKRRKQGEFRNCLRCRKEIYISKADVEKTKKGITGVRTNGKYCSNKCQGQYVSLKLFEEKLSKFEAGGCTPETLEMVLGKDNSAQDKFLKKYLIHRYPHGKTGQACWHCDEERVNKWTGNIPTVINHVDGNPNNQKITNLEIICCTCDALSQYYGRRGQGGRTDFKGNPKKR